MSGSKPQPADVNLQQLVAEADTGGRKAKGPAGRLRFCTAVTWSLFQLWFPSPVAFVFGFGVFNDTEARAIHLGFAVFLAFVACPALKSWPRDKVPLLDWALAALGA